MDGMTRDVRMRGFSGCSDVDAVLRQIEEHVRAQPGEPVHVADSIGRVLACEQTALVDVPGFDRSAMDGYALKGEQTLPPACAPTA